MPLSDYAHWNEDAEYMWWHEEGKHVEEPPEPDPYDDRGDYEYDEAAEEQRHLDAGTRLCLEEGNFNGPRTDAEDQAWHCMSCHQAFDYVGGQWVPRT